MPPPDDRNSEANESSERADGPVGASAASRWRASWPPIRYWAEVTAAVLAVILAFRLVGILQDVVLVLAISLVLAIGLQPAIAWLERRGLHRGLAILALILAMLALVIGLGFLIVPTIVDQISKLVTAFPDFLDRIESGGGWPADLVQRLDLIERVEGAGNAIAGAAVNLLRSIGSAAFLTLVVFVLTPSFAYNFMGIKRWAVRLLGRERREDFLYVLNRSSDLVSHYILGNLVVSILAGVTSYIAFSLMGVPFPVVLAVFIAVTDLIPAVGATIGAIGAVLVAAIAGVPQLIGTVIFVVAYQQLENHVIVPRVMKKAIDLSPATVIVAILVGGKMAGLVGVLLALPIAATIKVIITEFVLPGRMDAVRVADAEEGPQPRRQRGAPPGQRPLP